MNAWAPLRSLRDDSISARLPSPAKAFLFFNALAIVYTSTGIYIMYNASFFCVLLVFVLYNPSSGQNKVEPINKDIRSQIIANAPQRITRDIIQDSKGKIWLATHQGIFRYDGQSFSNITREVSEVRTDAGLEDRFYAVLEDTNGNFWFGSTDSGVHYYDGHSIQHFTTREGLLNDRIVSIYQDRTGNIWFATLGGISRYDGKSFQNFTMNEGLPHNEVITIAEDKTGRLWVGTRGGACTYDGKAFTILYKENGYSFGNVRSIIEDREGHVWLGGGSGLWRYDGNGFTNITTNFVSDIMEDNKGNIWICSANDREQGWAVSYYSSGSSFTNRTTLAESDSMTKPILCIFEDSDGAIWFGSFGVYRYDGSVTKYFAPN